MTQATDAAVGKQWYLQDSGEVLAELNSSADNGLSPAEAAQRLQKFGPNKIASEPPPSIWSVAAGQFMDPMNLMLVAVAVVSLLIGQVSTGLLVAALVVLNVVMGTRQEMKARASVDALAKMQVPQARTVRGGSLVQIPATDLVPGDIVNLEAGDLVPADGRLLKSASLETQEAALTGESAPIAKDPGCSTGRMLRSATGRTWCSRTPPSPAGPRPWWSRIPG